MSSKADVNRRTRGELLTLVRRYGPNGISYPAIEAVFHQAGRFGVMHDLEEHLLYLHDKGYLDCRRAKDDFSGVERWIAWITPRGIDLLDGILPDDPGVEVVR